MSHRLSAAGTRRPTAARLRHPLPRLVVGALLAAGAACASDPAGTDGALAAERLRPLPPADTIPNAPRGVVALGITAPRDGRLYVPSQYDSRTPMPLVLLLHGASGSAGPILTAHQPLADTLGLLLLAVDSRGSTWDAIRGGFGPDITYLDAALAWVSTRYAVDRSRMSVAGFSDGATYALAIGRANGTLFRRVIAHAPGFLREVTASGRPSFFVAHGTQDAVLAIDQTSRRLVPALRSAGYDVQYREWNGPHAISAALAGEALRWAIAP